MNFHPFAGPRFQPAPPHSQPGGEPPLNRRTLKTRKPGKNPF
jgi:hypothetical protein